MFTSHLFLQTAVRYARLVFVFTAFSFLWTSCKTLRTHVEPELRADPSFFISLADLNPTNGTPIHDGAADKSQTNSRASPPIEASKPITTLTPNDTSKSGSTSSASPKAEAPKPNSPTSLVPAAPPNGILYLDISGGGEDGKGTLGRIEFFGDAHAPLTFNDLSKLKGEAVYGSVAVNNLVRYPAYSRNQRNSLAEIILLVSNYNANVWLSRTFSNKAAAETAKGFLHDILVGAGATTAGSHTGLSQILSVLSFLVDKTVDNIDKNYFASLSYEAMETAIQAKRKELGDGINQRLKTKTADEYTMTEVLNDILILDEICSMKGGLRELQARAAGQNITLPAAPTITNQPASLTAGGIGSAVTLSVVADGTPPLAYQWSVDGTPILGANAAALALTNLQLSDSSKKYTVVVSNKQGQAVSLPVSVSVLPARLTIITAKTALIDGEKLTLIAASSADWFSKAKFVWSLNGKPIKDENAATFSKPRVTSADAGSYMVTATDNDNHSDFAVPLVLSVLSINTQPKASVSLAGGGSESLEVEAVGAPPLAYQWYQNGAPILGATSNKLSLAAVTSAHGGIYFATVTDKSGHLMSSVATVTISPYITKQPAAVSVAAGMTANLQVEAAGIDPLAYQWYLNNNAIIGAVAPKFSKVGVGLADAGDYTVTISDKIGTKVTSDKVHLTVTLGITKQPEAVTVAAGNQIILNIEAASPSALIYQWYRNDKKIDGATKATFTANTTAASDAGDYKVEVSDATGAKVTSNSVLVTVTSR